jgi:hypothetical protein
MKPLLPQEVEKEHPDYLLDTPQRFVAAPKKPQDSPPIELYEKTLY